MRRQRHYWQNEANLCRELEAQITTQEQGPGQAPIRQLPMMKELRESGHASLAGAINRYGGMKTVSKLVGAQTASR